MRIDVVEYSQYKNFDIYQGHEILRTEECTGYKIFEKGDVITHFSDRKIKKFANIETCFWEGNCTGSGHKYIYTFQEKTKCRIFGNQEIRKILKKGDFLEYDGEYEMYKTGEEKRSSRTGRMIACVEFRKI